MVTSALWRFNSQPRICIVGAGLSGLRAAAILAQKGCHVSLLEARDRIGGRVYPRPLQLRDATQVAEVQNRDNDTPFWIDMGANWIHGATLDNPIMRLALETGTRFEWPRRKDDDDQDDEGPAALFDENGKRIGDEKGEELESLVWGAISDALKESWEKGKAIPEEKSLKDFVKEDLASKDIPDEDRKMALQLAEIWGSFIGWPFEYQSLRYFWLEDETAGANVFVSGSYRKILERISKPVNDGTVDLRLRNTVTKIVTVRAPSEEASPKISIEVQEKEGLESFDAVIVTIPLGCLKKLTITFEPPLPQRFQIAIRNVAYGDLEKVYLSFPQAFWQKSPLPYSKTVEPPGFPTQIDFLHPLYASDTNLAANLLTAIAFHKFRIPNGQSTILFYLHGPLAWSLTDTLKPYDPSSKEYLSLLTAHFEPYLSLLPNYAPENPACTPIAGIATSWKHDALAGNGSYSCYLVPPKDRTDNEEREIDRDIETLRRGIPEQGIWVAGEHTSKFESLGTTAGAYGSGERVAKEVLEFFSKKNM